jgi:very-short-patch-repair endonuclease
VKFEITDDLIERVTEIESATVDFDRAWMRIRVAALAGAVESPIELLMFAALQVVGHHYVSMPTIRGDGPNVVARALAASPCSQFVIVPQACVENYRLDFLVARQTGDFKWAVGVECDGHDYHERTKQQAKRDKSRDRYLLTAGVPVMRFTGSEIWANAAECAEEVFSHYTMAHHDVAWADHQKSLVTADA